MPPLSQATGGYSASGTTLEFIQFTGRENVGQRRTSIRRVRAHVTRRQHARSSKNNDRSHELQQWTATVSQSETKHDWGVSKRKPARVNGRRGAPQASKLDEDDNETHQGEQSLRPQLFLGCAQKDPFWTFSVDYSPLFPPVIAHYMSSLALPIAELDGPRHSGLLRTHWFPMAMSSPATMYTVLLMAASSYRAEHKTAGASPFIRGDDIILLKTLALQEVNRVLGSCNTELAVSDAILGAVAKLAAFEAIFGDKRVFSQHMAGLREMVQLRESLDYKLGPLDIFLKRMILWIDLNAAYFTGSTRVFNSGNGGLQVDVEINEPAPMAFAGSVKPAETV